MRQLVTGSILDALEPRGDRAIFRARSGFVEAHEGHRGLFPIGQYSSETAVCRF